MTASSPLRAPMLLMAVFAVLLIPSFAGTPVYATGHGGIGSHSPASSTSHPFSPGALARAHLASLRLGGVAPPLAGLGVDPYAHYASEPAPMGITDFGVYPDGTGYTYSTSTFVGTATFHKFSAYTSAIGAYESGLQLNVVLYFDVGGTTYAYWIQDVVFLSTTNGNVQFLDNIWNFTDGSGGGVFSNSVTGNGSCRCSTVTPGIYIAVAGTQPGNNVNLTDPYTIQLRAFTTVVGGTPRVYFDYNDGFGWQTYDTAVFPFAKSVASAAFRVDGTQYVMGGLYSDAELVLGGPGGGTSSSMTEGGVNLSLEYDNGHNLQVVPNTYNFGSDTAEAMDHAATALGSVANGTGLSDQVSYGKGSLSELYNSSAYASLTVSAPSVPNGTLSVGGVLVPYRGGSAVLSLTPGSYPLGLYSGATLLGATNVTLAAGSPKVVTLPLARFAVTFLEQGLPKGTPWQVHLGTSVGSSQGSTIVLTEENGTFGYSIAPVPGYVTPRPSSPVHVSGGSLEIVVPFWTYNFTVDFSASNLPTGTGWQVQIGSASAGGVGTDLAFSLPNGTYNYSVTTSDTFAPLPASGNFSVEASGVLIPISFSLRPAYLVGVVRPMNATVAIDGQPVPVSDGSFNISELPGVYALEASLSGYIPKFLNVTLTPGNGSTVEILLDNAPSTSSSHSSHPGTSSASALPPWVLPVALIGVVAAVGLAGYGLISRRPKTR
ncbi:MAG: thermopsin [Thermoplasmata archaeon]|nr:thermopsin [Thermoplasmata archaeon]